MKKSTALAMVVGLGLSFCPAAQAWISLLDGSEDPELNLSTPWIIFRNEGGLALADLGGGNFALRLDSPAHSDPEFPDPDPNAPAHANEYYTFRNEFGVPTENVAAARFRLVNFSPTGKENLLSVTVNGGPDGMLATAPSITLVDGDYWVWSYTTNEAILELGPAVAGQWHEAYVMARNNGTAQVWWDGALVLDGPVPLAPDFAD